MKSKIVCLIGIAYIVLFKSNFELKKAISLNGVVPELNSGVS